MNEESIGKLKLEYLPLKLILNKPEDIHDFDGLTFDTAIIRPKYDLIFTFIFVLEDFVVWVNEVIRQELLNPNGYLYFAYPKKGNKRYKEYIGRDDFFPSIRMDEDGFVDGSQIKFNKMLAFSDVFTCIGLKYETKVKSKTQPSQCVADYIEQIPNLKRHFSQIPEILKLYNNLAPGYQKNWARYVFSAQTETTVQKRLKEMENMLKQGYKSIDLYRQRKK